MATKKPKHSSRSKSASKGTANSRKRGRGQASQQAAIRAQGGRFPKGRSGNPGGRPKDLAQVKKLASAHTTAAIERLAFWMRSENAKASVAAANALLDRAWGKATQAVTGPDGGPLDVNLNEVRGGLASKLDRIASALEKASVPRKP